jgi:hypothetical protein
MMRRACPRQWLPSTTLVRRLRAATFGTILVALVAGCGGPAPTATARVPSPPAAVSASPTAAQPTAEPTATAGPPVRALAPGERSWARVPFENGLRDRHGGSLMRAVAAGPNGIVAVGAAATGAAAWTSRDGLKWERATPARGWDKATLMDVASTPAGFVAVGWRGGSMEGPSGGAVWTSIDGRAWTRVAGDVGPGLADVVAQGDVVYAVGVQDESGSPVWRSEDGGRTWDRVAGLPQMDIFAIAAGPEAIVAGGQHFRSESGWEVAFLWSRDGVTWVPADVAPTEGEIHDVTWTDDRFVAVGAGSSETGEAAAWVSPDGETWSQASHSPVFDGNGRGVHLAAVAGTGDGRLVAVGPGPDGHAGLWFADDDGLAWALAPAPDNEPAFEGAYEPTDVVAADGRIVVVGSYPDPPRMWSAAVWTNPAPPGGVSPSPGPSACPGRRPELLALAELPAEQRLACYLTRTVTFRALVAPRFIGDGDYVIPEPAWLNSAGWCAHPVEGDRDLLLCLELHATPRSRVVRSLPRDDEYGMAAGAWLWVTGRFGDPAAEGCAPDGRERCRQAFVITRVRAAKAP